LPPCSQLDRINGKGMTSTQAIVNSSSSAMLSRMRFLDLALLHLPMALASTKRLLDMRIGSRPAFCQDVSFSLYLDQILRTNVVPKTAPHMAIRTLILAVWIRTTLPTPYTQTTVSEIPGIDNGTGSSAMSHLRTGRSKTSPFTHPPRTIQTIVTDEICHSGAPRDTPTIVSRLVTREYWQRTCGLMFPEVNGYTYGSTNPNINVHSINKHTKGWRLDDTTRLIWTNGEFDPWRTSGMSSQFRPGGQLASTPEHPVQIIPGGFHCSDLILRNGAVNAGVQNVIDNEVAQIKTWVAEYYTK
jgi:hypothetical protein